MSWYDSNSIESIIEYAQKLRGKSLRDACGEDVAAHGYSGKGNFGQILEKFYFGYEPNSVAEPDFKEAGIELKSSPLKKLKNGEFRSKERLVLNIINYLEIPNEDFETSSFWLKNAKLLLIFYLFESDINVLDYIIHLIGKWDFPQEDLKIIRRDWEIIVDKINNGRAHELSEGDTLYLGACTKGSTAEKSLRSQPYNSIKAKQRAFSLKQGYVNHIIAKFAQEEKLTYGKILEHPAMLDSVQSFEQFVINLFKPFYGKSCNKIEEELGLNLNTKSKNYFSSLTNAMLGLELGKKIEEFEKADIIVKTVRLKVNDLPKEDISFPAFEYKDLVETEWEDSDFKSILESKFFFVFYQFEDKELILRQVKFWNMPQSDIQVAYEVWDKTVDTILKGKIVHEVTNKGVRKTYFPKKSENKISHVRPHAKNAADTFDLPVPDKLTGLCSYTKHSFWLNASYVRDEVYLK